MNSRIIFPHCLDSTMLGTFRSCPHKMFRSYMEHWKPQVDSVHLIAGGAFARGIEVARKVFFEGLAPEYKQNSELLHTVQPTGNWLPVEKGDAGSAMAYGLEALIHAYGDFDPPPDSAKSLARMMGALEFYFESYPLGADGTTPISFPDGRTGIEFSFAEPLPVNHPITGDPILYTGRSDLIAEFAGGCYIFDEKTTSSLGQSWPRQWEMRSQFTGYSWAAAQSGIKVDGTIVRGVSILKTKYDTMQAITNRSQYEIDRWLDQTCRDIERLIEMWKTGYYDFSLDHACSEYAGCQFQRVCKSPDPETWLPMYFEKKVWDPLARKELTVEEYEASWEK